MNAKWNALQISVAQQQCLTTENPVILDLKSGRLQPSQGIKILQQYFYLVATITQFLTTAMARIPVAEVKQELRRNLDEELGSRTSGISHQELLESLLMKELGVAARTEWNEATKNFISSLLLDFNTRPTHFIAGMIYALEATACPELLVVAEIINLSAQKRVVDIAKLKDPSYQKCGEVDTLQGFLAAHTLDFELGHESGLRSTLEEFVSANWEGFDDGFGEVLNGMGLWWESLAKKARLA